LASNEIPHILWKTGSLSFNRFYQQGIKMYTLMCIPLRLQHVLIFFIPSSWSLHQTSLCKTQVNYQID